MHSLPVGCCSPLCDAEVDWCDHQIIDHHGYQQPHGSISDVVERALAVVAACAEGPSQAEEQTLGQKAAKQQLPSVNAVHLHSGVLALKALHRCSRSADPGLQGNKSNSVAC